MQEAWLLFDEKALRQAADNPNGKNLFQFPRLDELEAVPDPKEVLRSLIQAASGLRGRRLRTLSMSNRSARMAQLIEDFSPLRALSAFRVLEEEVSLFARASE